MPKSIEHKRIQYLTNLNVFIDRNIQKNLILLEVEGYSNNEYIGIPSLVKKNISTPLVDGILEFDLMLEPLEAKMRKVLNWSTRIVFDLNDFPEKLVGIKVNAQNNSDIVLVEPKLF